MKGDAAKAERNSLSQQIGQLMKNKQMDEVAELKRRVEAASLISAEVDAQLSGIDASIDSLLSVVPNLLDDRVPEGSDDAANVVVREWGAELRKVGEGFLWHDEIGLKLGTLDTVHSLPPILPPFFSSSCLITCN